MLFRKPFQRGEKELFVGGFSLVLVESFAEFAVKHVDVAAQPSGRYGVLDVFFHAGFADAEFLREPFVSEIFQGHYFRPFFRKRDETCEQAVAFEIRLEAEFQKIQFYARRYLVHNASVTLCGCRFLMFLRRISPIMAKGVKHGHTGAAAGIRCCMKSTGLRSALGIIKDFCRDNRKSVISFCALFALGIVIGIFITIDSAGGEFERISRADMEFGSVKVFFTTSFMVLAGYGVLLLGAGAPAFAVAGLVVFAVHGYYFGKYVCLLVAMYGATGVVNMIVVYIPFFLVTLVCMIVAGVRALNTVGCNRFRTAGLALLKTYGLNIAVNFVVFVIIGAFTKVIVVGF